MLRHLDLFSGIGGFALAARMVGGYETVAFCEIEPYCQAVLRKNFPGVRIFDDVRELRATDVGPVDVITGGFPCQDISIAGKAAGIEGARSGLWGEQCRLVVECQPGGVLIENVPALRTRGYERVRSDLLDAGYDSWGCVVGAYLVGAPFVGERVWIVAAPRGARLPAGWKVSGGTVSFQSMLAGRCRYRAVAGSKQPQWAWEEPRLVESPLGGATDGLQRGLVRFANGNAIKAFGNSIVPQVAAIFLQAIKECA